MSNGRIEELEQKRFRSGEEKRKTIKIQEPYTPPEKPKAAQSVVKVMNYAQGGKSTTAIMEYIARTNDKDKEDIELEDRNGMKISGKEEIAEVVGKWKKDFDPVSKNPKTRHVTHMLLSADTNVKNIDQVTDAARSLLKREFGDKGFDYVFVPHSDTQNPHVHVVIKNQPRDLGVEKPRKLRLNPNDLLHLRKEFAKELNIRGLEHEATRTKDDPVRFKESIRKRLDGLKKNMSWYQATITALEQGEPVRGDIRKKSRYLQGEVLRIKELVIKSGLAHKEKKEFAEEYKQLTKEIAAMRTTNELAQIEATVKSYSQDTMQQLANSKEVAGYLSDFVEIQRAALVDLSDRLPDKTVKRISDRFDAIQAKLEYRTPTISEKDLDYIGLDRGTFFLSDKKITFDGIRITDENRKALLDLAERSSNPKLSWVIKEFDQVALSSLEKAGIAKKDIKAVAEVEKLSQDLPVIDLEKTTLADIQETEELAGWKENILDPLQKEFSAIGKEDTLPPSERRELFDHLVDKIDDPDLHQAKEEFLSREKHIDKQLADIEAYLESIQPEPAEEGAADPVVQEETESTEISQNGQEPKRLTDQEIEDLKLRTRDELHLSDPRPVLDSLGIDYKENGNRLVFKAREERTASANMYVDNKTGEWKFKDFGGANGTIENVVMETTGKNYKDALEYSIDKAGTRNYLQEKFDEIKHGKVLEHRAELSQEDKQRLADLKEANLNFSRENSVESKVVSVEPITPKDKDVIEFLKDRGIDKIPEGFYRIRGEFETPTGKKIQNEGVGILTGNLKDFQPGKTKLDDIGADIHLLKKVKLRDGSILKTQTFGNKDITVIDNPKATRQVVIESKMDYAAAKAKGQLEDAKVILANGTGNAHRVVKELQKSPGLPTAFYNQNDNAGAKFVHSVATGAGLSKFDYISYAKGEEKQDINDLVKNKVDLSSRKISDRKLEDFVLANREHLPKEAEVIDKTKEQNKIQEAKRLRDELLVEKQKIRSDFEAKVKSKLQEHRANVQGEKEQIREKIKEIREVLQEKKAPEDFFSRERPAKEPAKKDIYAELKFEYLNPVKSPDPIRTARENVKLVTGTFAAYENQIRRVNDAIKDIVESGITSKEAKEKTKPLKEIREEFRKGLLDHIRTNTPKVLEDIKKADKQAMTLAPDQRKEIRALNLATVESLHNALDGAKKTIRNEFSGWSRHQATADIEKQQRSIERGFDVGKGRGL